MIAKPTPLAGCSNTHCGGSKGARVAKRQLGHACRGGINVNVECNKAVAGTVLVEDIALDLHAPPLAHFLIP